MPNDDHAFPLFVYGTLRSDLGYAAAEREQLTAIAERFGRAVVAGRLFDLGPYPAMLDPRPGASIAASPVVGELWQLRPGQTLEAIDRYEGFGDGFSTPNEFIRVARPALPEAGVPTRAWVYLYNWPMIARARQVVGGDLPSGLYPA